MSFSKMEDLQVQLDSLNEKNQLLYSTKIQPALQGKVQEFLDVFEDFFRERGFVIRKEYQLVRVAYDSLEFTAFSKGGEDIFILKEREQIASISVKYKKTKLDHHLEIEDPLKRLELEIKNAHILTEDLKNPVFYYTGSEFGHRYDTPQSVIKSIFQI